MFSVYGPDPRPGGPLVVVAVLDEAQAFAERVPTLVTGIGKVQAAVATSWAITTFRPGVILNAGTAGGLRDDPALSGAVLEVGTVIQHDLDGRAIARLTGVDPTPPLALCDSPIVLATGDRFISSELDRQRLAAAAHLVDMEGYAVAAAARAMGVPVRLAKVVSDNAGHGAAASWVDALHAASGLLAAWLTEVVADYPA